MTFNIKLWEVSENALTEVPKTKLDYEERLKTWIANDATILGIELLIIGVEVPTEFGGRIDLLGIDRQGNTVVIELKRDKTPRQIVAQTLDYASWVRGLVDKDINIIASKFLKESLSIAFSNRFGESLPDNLNTSHSMIIVASELDDVSERIVQYLTDEHQVNINVVFFSFFQTNNQEFLGRAWLKDPEQVQEISESRKRGIWSGYWFINVGEGTHRNWDDNKRYGFIGAGQGEWFSQALHRLSPGDKIFAYMKGLGYVGYGEVRQEAVMIKDFIVEEEEKSLLDLPLVAPSPDENSNNPDLSEWVVGIDWVRVYPREEAKTFKGIFANPNIVCKLRHEPTIEFLEREFGISD